MPALLFDAKEREFAEAMRGLAVANPFLPERVELERRALGDAFVASASVWHVDAEQLGANPNLIELERRAESLVERVLERLRGGTKASKEDRQLYQDLAMYHLYYRYQEVFYREITDEGPRRGESRQMTFYRRFRDNLERLMEPLGAVQGPQGRPEQLFALFFQIRRAFHHTFRHIFGGSMAAARLRAAVWQSIFTHDMRRYRRALCGRMHSLSTLILGPSGTGKELVASAIALSRFIPFDPATDTFAEEFRNTFLPINLSALSPSLIESELFGHRKGSFTGAMSDRAGYLEGCGPAHTVFLDEIGDLDPSIQVKLLRVLETRQFSRIGEVRARPFGGKIIAATNRDLATEMQAGRFRGDFYYRLCSDLIVTPSLREQLADSPQELRGFILLLARRVVEAEDAESIADEVARWIDKELGPEYPWPGNVRELEQCVRNVLVRGSYRPLTAAEPPAGPVEQLARDVCGAALDADELLSRYCTLMYFVTGGYEAAARRLRLDRRTVKRRIDAELLDALRAGGAGP